MCFEPLSWFVVSLSKVNRQTRCGTHLLAQQLFKVFLLVLPPPCHVIASNQWESAIETVLVCLF